MKNHKNLSAMLFNKSIDELNPTEQHVLKHIAEKEPISRDTHADFSEHLTFGQRIADKVAAFGGSWPFIGIFTAFLALWICGNTIVLVVYHHRPFDPFPYILLNLFLSMLAAIQAPVIMMSQNRQSAHDRVVATHDYEVNLKAELEIIALHQKLDELRELQWQQLLSIQKEQIDRLDVITQILLKKAEKSV